MDGILSLPDLRPRVLRRVILTVAGQSTNGSLNNRKLT